MACGNGCGRPPFSRFPTCCTHCKGPSGPHAADCEAKANAAAAAKAAGITQRVTAPPAAAPASAPAYAPPVRASAPPSSGPPTSGSRSAMAEPPSTGFIDEILVKIGASNLLVCNSPDTIPKGFDRVVQANLDERGQISWRNSTWGGMMYTRVPPETKWLRVVRPSDGDLTCFRCYGKEPPKIPDLHCVSDHILQKTYGKSGFFHMLASLSACESCKQEIRKGSVKWRCDSCDYNLCCSCAEDFGVNLGGANPAKKAKADALSAAGLRWQPLKHGTPMPRDAVLAGETKTDGGVVYVGRYRGEAGKINTSDGTTSGKMHNFWANNAKRQTEADVLCIPAGGYEWLTIQSYQRIPAGAVKAGQTPKDGVTYVARYRGEAGKINEQDGQMWNFWGSHSGSKQDAEILTTVGIAPEAAPSASPGMPAVALVRSASAYKHAEHIVNKPIGEQRTDALRRLKRLVEHGDATGAELMLARAVKLEVPKPELTKIEADLKKLKEEGDFVLLKG